MEKTLTNVAGDGPPMMLMELPIARTVFTLPPFGLRDELEQDSVPHHHVPTRDGDVGGAYRRAPQQGDAARIALRRPDRMPLERNTSWQSRAIDARVWTLGMDTR
jgi:hypothetical protein